MADKLINAQIRHKRDSASNWESANPILESGVFGWDTTNKRGKIGDGNLRWNSLEYVDRAIIDELANVKSTIYFSSGMAETPSFTDNLDGSFTIGNGIAHLYTNPDYSEEIVKVSVIGNTFTPADNTQSYLVINYNNGSPLYEIITNVELIDEGTIIPVYSIYREGNELFPLHWDQLGYGLVNKMHQRFIKTARFERETGFILSELPTRIVQISSGLLWYGAVRNELSAVNSSTGICHFHYHVNGAYVKTSTTQYNNQQYDDGNNLVALKVGRYTVNWIYRAVEDGGHLDIVLGDDEYKSVAEAVESQPRNVLPEVLKANGMLVGRIIVQKGDSTASRIDSAFTTTFLTTPINIHNDLAEIQGGVAGEHYHLSSAQSIVVQNTSGVNTGDQDLSNLAEKTYVDNKVKTDVPAGAVFTDNDTITTINGKTGAIAKADIVALGIPAQDTAYVHPNHSGDVTSVADGATTIANKAVTLAKMADMATASLLGRKTAGTGVPEVLSKSDAQTLLNVEDGANNYVHPTGDGNLHVPPNSTTNEGKVLTAGATAGAYTWEEISSPAPDSVVNKNTGEQPVKFWTGTLQEWELIEPKDPDTIYFCI